MRLLSKNSRENKTGKPAVLGEDVARTETVQHQIESTQAIGQRYETIHGGLDSIGRVMEHLKAIEPLIAEIRGPVAQEFDARRAEHAELIALRANFDTAQRQIAQIQADEREVSARLAAAETALGESDARRQTQDAALEDNALEIDRLRNALLQSDLKVSSLDASLRDANARIEHLVQDVEGLRAQAQDIDARRGDAEAALARANQDNALLGEEAATLKKRVDQAGVDLARLARIETDLEAQIAAERARVQALENALSAHQVDSGRNIRGLEGQVEASRAEISALQTRLETSTGRADKLEEMNTQISARLAESSAHQKAVERRAGDLNVALERALERIRALEEESDGLRQRHAGVDTARATAIERADQMAKSATAQEKAMKRAEERAQQLRARLDAMQEAQDQIRREHEEKIADLQATIERLTSEAALAEGALEAARRDRSRLQMALLGASDGDLAESA
jgi:crescentin